jgi:transcription-repair coupling factor (superfamily II helicase)
MADRLRALYTLVAPLGSGVVDRSRSAVVVACASSVISLVPSPNALLKRTLELSIGDLAGFDSVLEYLETNGYHRAGQVESAADYAVRGGLIDVFPAGFERPIRLDFFGDDLESIRSQS